MTNLIDLTNQITAGHNELGGHVVIDWFTAALRPEKSSRRAVLELYVTRRQIRIGWK
jgi:hypothetical protein